MSKTIADKISADRFDFNRETKEYSQDISMLQHAHLDPLGRLFDDAADRGFIMKSPISGRELTFQLLNESKDSEHEIRFWTFGLVPGVYEPKIADVRVIIFND